MVETVLVVGSTGNIGLSAVKGALNAGRNVLAIVRNQKSAEKLKKYIDSSEPVTFVEADVISPTGVKSVVDRVRAGELPAFQHVWSSVGGDFLTTKLSDITPEVYDYNMRAAGSSGFSTIKYLWEQNNPVSTWTICTGGQVDLGTIAMLCMGQGPIVAMSKAACKECLATNVRFNEVYLCTRVEADDNAAAHKVTSSSEFSKVYSQLLDRQDIRSTRVSVLSPADLEELKFATW